MRTLLRALTAVLFAIPLYADPVITSISQTTVPTMGNATIIISGSGFEACPICSPPTPPQVLFGNVPAASVQLLDPTRLQVVTPRFLPATVPVYVRNWDRKTAQAPALMTFSGPPALEPVLFPIYSAPVFGANGSEFGTVVRAANRSTSAVGVLGVDTTCYLFSPVQDPYSNPTFVPQGLGSQTTLPVACSQWPARILYVHPADAGAVSFNVRVADVTRNASSHGTEIPVVRTTDMTNERIVLPGVPVDERFRALLRIYSMEHSEVLVSVIVNGVVTPVRLYPGETIFEPAYATFNDFPKRAQLPSGQDTFSVVVVPPSGPVGPSPVIPGVKVWAFITVTNNETQEITTITPDM